MPRAAKDLQWGHMQPAGRQFDMPGLLHDDDEKICFQMMLPMHAVSQD